MELHALAGQVVEGRVELHPESGSPKYKALRIGLDPTFEGEIPQFARLVRNKRTGALVLRPGGENDPRHLVLGEFVPSGHRDHVRIDDEATTAKVVARSNGFGGFGSGEVFVAVIDGDEHVVSIPSDDGFLQVIEIQNGKAVLTEMTEEEYATRLDENEEEI